MNRATTIDQDMKICAAYQDDHLSMETLAERYSVGVGTIANILRRYQIPTRQYAHRSAPAEIPCQVVSAGPVKRIPALDPKLSRAERARAQLAGYFESEVRR